MGNFLTNPSDLEVTACQSSHVLASSVTRLPAAWSETLTVDNFPSPTPSSLYNSSTPSLKGLKSFLHAH